MPHYKLFVFGPPRFETDGDALDVKPRKAMALLVFLAVTRQPHTRDALATLFWPDTDQQTARASLRRTLYRLSQSIPAGLIEIGSDLIQIVPATELWTDLDTYRRFVEACFTSGAPDAALDQECINQLELAAQLFQDDFLAGFSLPDAPAFDEWQFFESEELRRTQATILEWLAEFYTSQGEFGQAVPHVRQRLAIDPLHEPAHRQLMQLYAWTGQHSAAMRQYQECVRILQAELDAPPDDETTALYEAIRTKRLPSPPTTSPATPAATAKPAPAQPLESAPSSDGSNAQGFALHTDLSPASPVRAGASQSASPATPFIGRDRELDTIFQILVSEPLCRLLTLVGPGGIGKTRLTTQLIERLTVDPAAQARFPDGVCFINLAPVETVERFLTVAAEAVGLAPYNLDSETLRGQLDEQLRDRRALMVLDNFEQLLDNTWLLAELLKNAPHIKILVTSRIGLDLQEAWFYPIAGLAYPRAGTITPEPLENYEAVRLFIQAARRARIDFQLPGEEEHVLRICRMVEGTPLALELAASWLKVLPPAQIAQEIQNNLDILTSRYQNVEPRHRSMRAVLEQSWSLLSRLERDILMQLAMFRGGFRAAAAQAVAGASLATLAVLVEKSLIRLDETGRYQIHELLRQFALDMLEDIPELVDEVYRRHSDYYFAYLRERGPWLTSPRQPHILREVNEELENIEIAWQFVLNTAPEQLLNQEISSFWRVYWISGRAREGLAIFSNALQQLQAANLEEPSPLTGVYRHLLQQRALYLYFLGYVDEALRDFETCVRLATRLNSPLFKADALVVMGSLYIWKGERQASLQHLNEALSLFRASGSTHGEADTLQEMARLHLAFGDFNEALHCASQTLAVSRRLERPDWIAYGYLTYGWAVYCQGDYMAARRSFADALELFREIGHQLGIAGCLGGLGWVAWAEGHEPVMPHLLEEAETLVSESLDILRRIGHRIQITHRLYCLAQIYLDQRQLDKAQQVAEEGIQTGEQVGASAFFVGNLLCLSQAAWEQKAWAAAREYLRRGLTIASQRELRPLMVNGLYHYGLLRLAEAHAGPLDAAAREEGRYSAQRAFQIAASEPAGWHAHRERARHRWQALRTKDAQIQMNGAGIAQAELALSTLEDALADALMDLQATSVEDMGLIVA